MSRTGRDYLKYAVLLFAAAFSTLSAFAATLTVTNLNDSGTGSLRAEIAAAAAGDTIDFQPGLTGTITLTSGTLAISQNLTISGPGAPILAVSGNNFTVFTINSGTVFISGLTIENSNLSASGFINILGGGIFNSGMLTVTNSTISDNTASSGGFVNISGGGIYNNGTLTVTNSTISHNTASNSGGIANVSGGGIFNNGTLTMTNSTISSNTASSGGGFASVSGGGILNNGTLTVTNSTISGNNASSGGGFISGSGGGIFNSGASATLKSTIVANSPSGGNCSGNTIGSQGYNLSDDGTCGFSGTGDHNNTPAGLDPNGLQYNGGPTQTIALLVTSPAVDAIPVAACTDQTGNPVTTDQRGVTRPQGPGCDIGAYELILPAFAIRYVSNLNIADSVVNITNTGASATAVLPPGQTNGTAQNNIDGSVCVNIYAFAADEQEVACCSCLVTPNGLYSASVKTALLNSTLTPSFPNEVVIKLLPTTPLTGTGGVQTCNPASPTSASLASGLLAWGTTVHGVPTATGPTFSIAETPFSQATLTSAELARDVQECQFIQVLGSGQFGLCKGCSNVGLGAAAQ